MTWADAATASAWFLPRKRTVRASPARNNVQPYGPLGPRP